MKKKNITLEQELVLQLIHYLEPNYDRINEILECPLDWNQILGMLNFHRVAGLAYHVLNRKEINHKNLHRPIMFGLGVTFDAFYARAKVINRHVQKLNNRLEEKSIKCAFLKGTMLTNVIYPWGCRASSDVDILVNASDIDNVDCVLRALQYKQGEYDFVEHKIIEFDRRELIYRRMNWGEVAMYHKAIDEPCATKVSIDVNFSLDWHSYNTKNIVKEFLKDVVLYKSETSDVSIYSLNKEVFLLQLCVHAYKEINLFKSVQIMQDLELYKFVDIYTFIELDYVNWKEFVKLVREYKYERECYLVLKYIEEIFVHIRKNKILEFLLKSFEPANFDYMNEVFDPVTNEKYVWKGNVLERLFNPNHKELLRKE